MKILKVLGATAIGAMLLGSPSDAEARYLRFAGNTCRTDNGTSALLYPFQDGRNESLSTYSNGNTAVYAFCPIPDDSTFLNSSLTGVVADVSNSGYQDTGSVSMQVFVCRASNTSLTTICSNSTSTTNSTTVGILSLGVDTAAINLLQSASQNNWYSTLVVRLPRENWGNQSWIMGYGIFN